MAGGEMTGSTTARFENRTCRTSTSRRRPATTARCGGPVTSRSVPMNPMVDGWRGDDWFHNGAFREQNMPYIYEQEATRDNSALWWTSHLDDYDVFMEGGSGRQGRGAGFVQRDEAQGYRQR